MSTRPNCRGERSRFWLVVVALSTLSFPALAAEPAAAPKTEAAATEAPAEESSATAEPQENTPAPPTKPEVMRQFGWLKPNSSHPRIGAPFVLVDSTGLIRCYVRPAPGLDMQPFVDQKVRIRGTVVSAAEARQQIIETYLVADFRNGRNVARARPQAHKHADHEHAGHDHGDHEGQQVSYEQPAGPGGAPRGAGMQPDGEQVDWEDEGQDYVGQEDWNGPLAPCSPAAPCGRALCNTCCGRFCGPPGKVWVRAEYLYWWTKGMTLPPLVTTGPSAAQPGYLGSTGTQILFGGQPVDGYGRSGGRITLGTWLNACQTVGIEGDYFQLATATANYSASSSGNPILSRPFFDIRPTLQDQNVEQVALPGSIGGTVAANTFTRYLSGGLRMRFNICCGGGCFDGYCVPNMNGAGGFRLDFLLGYRYARLADGVAVNENLISQSTQTPGTFLVNDSFRTLNQFNGIEFGTLYQVYRGRWSLELMERLAIGNVNQAVGINGSTAATTPGAGTTNSQGGLLALPSNIGHYSRNDLGVIPELQANLGMQITPRLKAIVGYTFIYWSNVARAGDQMDLTVNSNYLPLAPTVTPKGAAYPIFAYHDSAFWAQGISAGLEYRW